MNARFHAWIQRAAAQPGMWAAGVRLPNRSAHVESQSGDFSESQVAELLQGLSDALFGLRQNQIGTECVCWIFENGRIYCASRRDGTVGAVIAARHPDSASAAEALLADFQSIQD